MTDYVPNHTPTKTKVSEAITVRFSFELGDYCEFTVNETSGSFVVDGDAFTGSYSWRVGSNLGIEPPYTLLKGLDGFGIDYLAGKLQSGAGLAYDAGLTEKAVRAHAEELAWEVHRDELDDVDYETAETFLYTAPPWLDDAHLFIQDSRTRADRMLRERYLPAFKAWARERVLDKRLSSGK